LILVIETSTEICSVALAGLDGVCMYDVISEESFAHAESLPLMVEKIIKDDLLTIPELKAVAINAGPGSYTGLRIATSLAKGLCYAGGIPLIAVNGMLGMAKEAGYNKISGEIFISNIDARRDEFYCQEFQLDFSEKSDIHPEFTSVDFYKKHLGHKVVFCGNASSKIAEAAPENEEFQYFQTNPKAKFLCTEAAEKFQKKEFMDTAYFEPFYLKSFIPLSGKK